MYPGDLVPSVAWFQNRRPKGAAALHLMFACQKHAYVSWQCLDQPGDMRDEAPPMLVRPLSWQVNLTNVSYHYVGM